MIFDVQVKVVQDFILFFKCILNAFMKDFMSQRLQEKSNLIKKICNT